MTSPDYVTFVMDCLTRIPHINFHYIKMFGEYCVYANDKPILLVCDNQVFVKMLPCLETLMQNNQLGHPYPGSKPYYILNIEDSDSTESIIPLLEANTPLPKPRKRAAR